MCNIPPQQRLVDFDIVICVRPLWQERHFEGAAAGLSCQSKPFRQLVTEPL